MQKYGQRNAFPWNASRVSLFLLASGLAFLVLTLLPAWASAQSLDSLRREAIQLERARDCEGAYKKYQEFKDKALMMRRTRRRSGLLAFAATKMMRLKPCYEKCVPSDQEKQYLAQAKDYRERGQKRRAYRMLLRLLRGKNPRCTSWQEAHKWRLELRTKVKRRRSQKSVDPCDIEDDTKQKLTDAKTQIQQMQTELVALQKPMALPAPPKPPRWARKGRRYRWWLRRWKRRTQRKLRRKAERTEMRRLQKILGYYQKINTLRESIFTWREQFQNCDEVYTSLKEQSRTLKSSQEQTHQAVVSLYNGRVKRFQNRMRWFAGRYYRLKRNQKTDRSTVKALRENLQQQRELLDGVTQDLLALSNLLVFKPKQAGEGTLLQNSMGNFQKLMSDQRAMFAALQKQYPGYMQSDKGRKQLHNHLSALGRFEKVLERFQDRYTGDKSDKIRQTLHAVRGSILLFEKAEREMARKAPTTQNGSPASSGNAAVMRTSQPASVTGKPSSGSSPWGWLLLALGLVLALGASWYLWRERQMRRFSDTTLS